MNASSKRLLLLLAFIASALIAINQDIPNARTVDWNSAFHSFEFKYPQMEINVLDYGAAGDGIVDDYQAVADAISFASETGGIVYFPKGDYLLNSSISLGEGVILRGHSSDSSVLIFDLGQSSNNCIIISKSQSGIFKTVESGFDKESTKLLCFSSQDFVGADYAEIIQDNGDWDISPANWAENAVGQIIRIDEIKDDTIFFNNALRINFTNELNPRIRPIFPIMNCAVECLKIKRKDEVEDGAGSNIYFNYAANCIIKGVESDSSVGSHISINFSTNIKVAGNYIHHAFTYDGAGTRGYGIHLSQHTGECYIVNNIFKHLRHAMMIKAGSNGNIFAYNYSLEPIRTEPIPSLSGDISFHGHFAFSNLFEGNIIQNIIIDHYWGPSGPFNTLFRNRAELFGILMTTNEEAETGFQNFVGNETVNLQPLYGQYVITGEDHFEYGNNILGTIVPAGNDSLSLYSYYLTEKPIFWDDELNWPAIGFPNEAGENIIPAKQRYLNGGILTVCNDSVTTSKIEFVEIGKLKIWPNPATDKIYLKINESGKYHIQISDIRGRKLFKKTVYISNKVEQIDLSFLNESGVFIMMLQKGAEVSIAKLMIHKK